MKQPILLSQFDYSIMPSVIALAGNNKNLPVAGHLPLIKVDIDFENGILKMDGDWQFMMVSNKHNDPHWYNYHKGRVIIESVIYNSSIVDLNDPEIDGRIFPIEGSIIGEDHQHTCGGFMVIDRVPELNNLSREFWKISVYIYDQKFDDWEITFKLPVIAERNWEGKDFIL